MIFLNDEEIKDDSLQDNYYFVGCGSCVHFKANADMDGVKSECLRLDHKFIKFAVPWFKSYDCGQHSAIMCEDFYPNDSSGLKDHWTTPLDYAAGGDIERIRNARGGVWVTVGGNTSVRYMIPWIIFWKLPIGIDENYEPSGWTRKQYYKRDSNSPTGYRLVTEERKY